MANTYELIASSTVGSGGSSSVAFSSIASTWTDLCLKISARTNTALADGGLALEMRLNGSSTSQTAKRLQGTGSAANSDTYFYLNIDGSDYTASTFGNTEIYIPNYASSNYKSSSADSVSENNATGAYSNLSALLWSNTAAVSSITLVPISGALFVQNSTFYLYGVKNA